MDGKSWTNLYNILKKLLAPFHFVYLDKYSQYIWTIKSKKETLCITFGVDSFVANDQFLDS